MGGPLPGASSAARHWAAWTPPNPNSDRGSMAVLGTVLLLGVTVLLSASVGMTVLETSVGAEPPPRVTIELEADAATETIELRHVAGEALEAASLEMRITINGEALRHQPPVPFFAAKGFRGGPMGPFNNRTTGTWRAGQRASLRLASTNAPHIEAGDRVRVTVRTDYGVVSRRTTIATG